MRGWSADGTASLTDPSNLFTNTSPTRTTTTSPTRATNTSPTSVAFSGRRLLDKASSQYYQERNTHQQKLHTIAGKKFEEKMASFVHHEATRDLKGTTPKSRSILFAVLATLLWVHFLGFILGRRHLKTRAEALVIVLFQELLVEYPHLFMTPILKACRKFMREHVWQAWRFQKAIDLCPCGGLNYSGIEALRTIEELKKWEQGSIPSFQTVRRACLLLEMHAAQDFGLLDIHVAESENGKPSFTSSPLRHRVLTPAIKFYASMQVVTLLLRFHMQGVGGFKS